MISLIAAILVEFNVIMPECESTVPFICVWYRSLEWCGAKRVNAEIHHWIDLIDRPR